MMQGRSQPRHRRASGMSLIELLAALMIAAAVSALGVHYLRPTGESSKQRSCDLTRALLQNDAQRFLEANGRLPHRFAGTSHDKVCRSHASRLPRDLSVLSTQPARGRRLPDTRSHTLVVHDRCGIIPGPGLVLETFCWEKS